MDLLFHWLNSNEGVAGWVSGIGAFAAAGTALWIASWQNAQIVKQSEEQRKRENVKRDEELNLRRWLLAVALKPAILYVYARATGTRSGAIALENIENSRKPTILKKVGTRGWESLKVKLPEGMVEHMDGFSVFGPKIGAGLGEIVAYARLLNDIIDIGETFDRRPKAEVVMKRADDLLRVLAIVQAGIEEIIQAGPPDQ